MSTLYYCRVLSLGKRLPKSMSLKTWTLENSAGDSATILNYGARLIRWNAACVGDNRNLVLAYRTTQSYLSDKVFLGAVVGPFANRIANSRMAINSHQHVLVPNEGKHHLHGSIEGFDNAYWAGEKTDTSTLVLTLSQTEIHQGYPGNREFTITYSLDGNGQLTLMFKGVTDRPTVMGPTGHAYFNLATQGDMREHWLKLNACSYTEVNEELIPTGKIIPVAGTALDFRHLRKVSCALDNNFVVEPENARYHGTLYCPEKRVSLAIYSDYPGVQVYSGFRLPEDEGGQQGICLEPQFFPDSPNQCHFPFAMTTPDSPFTRVIVYQVSTDQSNLRS